jgi:predicted methyltransferase
VFPRQQPVLTKRGKKKKSNNPLMAEDTKEWLGIANKNSEAKMAEAVRYNKKIGKIEKTRLVIEQKKVNPWSDRTSRINSPSM